MKNNRKTKTIKFELCAAGEKVTYEDAIHCLFGINLSRLSCYKDDLVESYLLSDCDMEVVIRPKKKNK